MRHHPRTVHWVMALTLGVCLLRPAGTAGAQQSQGTDNSTSTPDIPAAADTGEPATAAAATSAIGVWQTYTNNPAGFSLEYPATWTVDERAGDLAFSVTFTPPDGRRGFAISAQPSGATSREAADLPNVRCRPVTVGGLQSSWCLDTIERSSAAIVSGQDKTYTIAAPLLVDGGVLEHALQSFRLVSSASPGDPPPTPVVRFPVTPVPVAPPAQPACGTSVPHLMQCVDDPTPRGGPIK